MRFFLNLKHWQLFLIATVIPMVLYFGTFFTVILLGNPFLIFRLFPIIMLLFIAGQYGWMFNVVRFLHPKLPESVKLKKGRFHFSLFFPVVYMMTLFALASIVFGLPFSGNADAFPFDDINPLHLLAFFVIIIPLHLFSMFCMFHSMYFLVKTLKSVELGREALLNDYIGDFFLMWFFYVGVWFLQPRVNELYKSSAKDMTADNL